MFQLAGTVTLDILEVSKASNRLHRKRHRVRDGLAFVLQGRTSRDVWQQVLARQGQCPWHSTLANDDALLRLVCSLLWHGGRALHS